MSEDKNVKSHADAFIDGLTGPYKRHYTELRVGCLFPVLVRWRYGDGMSVKRGDLVSGTHYVSGTIVARCTARIHSENLTVRITYKKTKLTGWSTVSFSSREYKDAIYEADGTAEAVITIPAYSESGSVHLSSIGNAYGIESIVVETSSTDFPNGMPGDAFELAVSGSPMVCLALALGTQFETVRQGIEDAFHGRFVHLKKCATCEGSGDEGTHGGTVSCPICSGTGTVGGDYVCPNCEGRGTVCPTCKGAKFDEQTSKLFYQIQRSKDLNARKIAEDENPKLTAMRMWSRKMWIHPTVEDVRKAAAFFTGCRIEDVEITETFNPHEPVVFIFVPYYGGPLNLFSFGQEDRNDLVAWAKSIRPAGVQIATGVYYPFTDDYGDSITDLWEDDSSPQPKITLEDTPHGFYGSEVGMPILMSPDSGKQPLYIEPVEVSIDPEPVLTARLAYFLNEGSGGVFNDSSGNGNHGTNIGLAWTPDGRIGSALQRSTAPGGLGRLPYGFLLNDRFTIVFLFRITNPAVTSANVVILSNGYRFQIYNPEGILVEINLGGTVIYPTCSFPIDTNWHLVAFAWESGDTFKIYINNSIAYTSPSTYSGTVQDQSVTYPQLFWRSLTTSIPSILDSFYIFERQLTTEELTSLYEYYFNLGGEGWTPNIYVAEPPEPVVYQRSIVWPTATTKTLGDPMTEGSFYLYFRHPVTHTSFQFVLHHSTGEQILFTATLQTTGYYNGRYTFSAPFDGYVDKFPETDPDPNHPYLLNLAAGQWLYIFTRFDTNRKKFWVTLICLNDPAAPVSTSMVLTAVIDAVSAFDQLESIEIRDGGGTGTGYISEFCLFDGDLT